MTPATLRPARVNLATTYAYLVPDHRDRGFVRSAYRELRRRGFTSLHARHMVIGLIGAGMNGRTLVEVP